jgi:hypothetical protein
LGAQSDIDAAISLHGSKQILSAALQGNFVARREKRTTDSPLYVSIEGSQCESDEPIHDGLRLFATVNANPRCNLLFGPLQGSL